jgi:hypothetical protein
MTRVLAFNLATQFDICTFARIEAVDLFAPSSGVTLLDATGQVPDVENDVWGMWPKTVDQRPKSISDEVLDHVRAAKSFSDRVIVLLIVDHASDVLPGADGEPDPPAQTAIKLIDKTVNLSSDNRRTDVGVYAVCLNGHEEERQRAAVVEFLDDAPNVDSIFFFAKGLNATDHVHLAGTRMLVDFLSQWGSKSEADYLLKESQSKAFVIDMSDDNPTRSTMMRKDFSDFVKGKADAGLGENKLQAMSSKEYEELSQLVIRVRDTVRSIEEQAVEPIEIETQKPSPKAPRYKSATLLKDLNDRAIEYETGIRLAAQLRIDEEVKSNRVSAFEGAPQVEELKTVIDNVKLPPMQFRAGLVHNIKVNLLEALATEVEQSENRVSSLRRKLSEYFQTSDEASPSSTRGSQENAASAHSNRNGLVVDLSQLKHVVSSAGYWETHTNLITAARRLPSRAYALAIYLAPLLLIWITAYCYMFGLVRTASFKPSDFPLWQHLSLTIPEYVGASLHYHKPAVVIGVWVLTMLCVNFVFRRIRKRVNIAHGKFLVCADALETQFHALVVDTIAYRKRARCLQIRKYFLSKLRQALSTKQSDQFDQATDMLKLRAHETEQLRGLELPRYDNRVSQLLKDASNSHNWIREYFGVQMEMETKPITIVQVGNSNQKLAENSIYFDDVSVDFVRLRDWKRQ